MITTAALIVAAGKGERAGGATPKQFAPLAGKPLLAHSLAAFKRHPAIGEIVIAIGSDQHDLARAAVGDQRFVTGGSSRRESVRAGLAAIASERVLIHDAARPLLPAAVIDRLLTALDEHDCAIPVLPVADTLVRGEGIVDRTDLMRVQTPQAFRRDAVITAHDAWPAGSEATDDAQMARAAGFSVANVAGDPLLEKVTRAEDFALAEARLAGRVRTRTGLGFDVHRLAKGEELWLGGVRIEHVSGLAGHSDADVALHALTDAILGAIAADDIGAHFPPSDPKWRGARSDQFLAHAAALAAQAGGRVEQVDLTIICEAPRIGPHRQAMRARIAQILALDIAAVSVKATTTEGLGLTGRGEGIAAQAVATVRVWEAY